MRSNDYSDVDVSIEFTTENSARPMTPVTVIAQKNGETREHTITGDKLDERAIIFELRECDECGVKLKALEDEKADENMANHMSVMHK